MLFVWSALHLCCLHVLSKLHQIVYHFCSRSRYRIVDRKYRRSVYRFLIGYDVVGIGIGLYVGNIVVLGIVF